MTSGRATIDDVAREAGVSSATVSRALRGMPNVAPATRERVAAVARELGYQAHAAASSLASGRTTTVGVVAPFFGIWYTSQVLTGIEETLAGADYDLSVYAADTPENRARFFARVTSLQTRIDGLILVDFATSSDEERQLRSIRKPIVSIGRRVDDFPSLTVENEAAAHVAVAHLLGLGHRRVAILGSEQIKTDQSSILEARLVGYRRALGEAGIPESSHVELSGDLTPAGGAAGLEHHTTLEDRPTAIFCLSDETAMGAMGRARELGIEVPGDLSIMGFDDHDLAEAFGLSTVHQPVREAGVLAARLLLEHVADPASDADHVLLPIRLVARSSTAAPR